jgi:hypothetical protein
MEESCMDVCHNACFLSTPFFGNAEFTNYLPHCSLYEIKLYL